MITPIFGDDYTDFIWAIAPIFDQDFSLIICFSMMFRRLRRFS